MMSEIKNWRGWLCFAACIGVLTASEPEAQERQLRVCSDPNNLPFSNARLEGFENKIAELIASDMGATLKYAWQPQRRGFIRRTLKAEECDLVMGVPSTYELVLPTKPYYRSTYVFAYPKGGDFRIQSFDDPALRKARIGLHAIGDDGFNPPPAHALARRGIVENVVGFPMLAAETVESPPSKIIDALAAGEIDVAIVWGPLAGYFGKRQPIDIEVVPVSPSADMPSMPFIYDIAMGVRPGSKAFKEEIERIIDARRADIQTILRNYGIPTIDLANAAEQPEQNMLTRN